MNRTEFERQLKDIPLSFVQLRGHAERRWLPSFLETYLELVEQTPEVVPTQEDYIQYYWTRWEMEPTMGVEARARRAYASIVREHHLGYLLNEHFTVLEHDQWVDRKDGVDYVVDYMGAVYLVHAFVDSPMSRYYREKKATRHPDSELGGTHVDLAINPDDAKRVGDWWVYDERHVEQLRSTMS